MKNKCRICGEPCRIKFCKSCAKEAYWRKGKPPKIKFNGCNEDCFNCPYPDCIKPVGQMKKDNSVVLAKKTGESQAKMYTVMLGGYGGVRPNISKKYYRSTLW